MARTARLSRLTRIKIPLGALAGMTATSFAAAWALLTGSGKFYDAIAPAAQPLGAVFAILGVTCAIGVLGCLLGADGASRADIEKPWNDQWNPFRELSDKVLGQLDFSYGIYRTRVVQLEEENWRRLVALAPWPLVSARPLKESDRYLTNDAPLAAQRLYGFAKALIRPPIYSATMRNIATGETGITKAAMVVPGGLDEYRRQGINLFHEFGTRLDDGNAEFAEFLARNAIRSGYADVVKLLAYLNVAVASVQRADHPGNHQPGFWSLASRWSDTGTTINLGISHPSAKKLTPTGQRNLIERATVVASVIEVVPPMSKAARILGVVRAPATQEQFITGEFALLVDMLVSEKTAFGNWTADLSWPDGFQMPSLPGRIASHACDVGRFELTVTVNYLNGSTRGLPERPISAGTVTRLSTVDHRGDLVQFTRALPTPDSHGPDRPEGAP
jgi:hypothetical protein